MVGNHHFHPLFNGWPWGSRCLPCFKRIRTQKQRKKRTKNKKKRFCRSEIRIQNDRMVFLDVLLSLKDTLMIFAESIVEFSTGIDNGLGCPPSQ